MLRLGCGEIYSSFIIGICCKPPNSDTSFIFHFNEAQYSISSQYPGAKIVGLDDFNYPAIDWNNLTSLRNSNECSGFMGPCLKFNLPQLVHEPKRVTFHLSNILDFVLTELHEQLITLYYLYGPSDHKIIHAQFTGKGVVNTVS